MLVHADLIAYILLGLFSVACITIFYFMLRNGNKKNQVKFVEPKLKNNGMALEDGAIISLRVHYNK